MAQPGSHALVFRVMRLARPSLTPEDTLRFSIQQDFVPDAAAAAQQPHLASTLPAGYPFAGRVQLDPAGGGEGQGGGLSGLLALPQSFGLVYLGETFSAYVTVCNNSDQPVTNVAVKVGAAARGVEVGARHHWELSTLLILGYQCLKSGSL